MIYLTKNFFEEKVTPRRYLILVVVPNEEKMLVATQIHRSHLDEATWLIVTPEECAKLAKKYSIFSHLVVMQITMTGNKKDIFFSPHNWEMLQIAHEPKDAPFDQAFAEVMNYLLDQTIANFNKESIAYQKRISQLWIDLMSSGMFQMGSNPNKALGR